MEKMTLDSKIYLIIEEDSSFKVIAEEEAKRTITNAFKVSTYNKADGFTSAEIAKNYLLKYCGGSKK